MRRLNKNFDSFEASSLSEVVESDSKKIVLSLGKGR